MTLFEKLHVFDRNGQRCLVNDNDLVVADVKQGHYAARLATSANACEGVDFIGESDGAVWKLVEALEETERWLTKLSLHHPSVKPTIESSRAVLSQVRLVKECSLK